MICYALALKDNRDPYGLSEHGDLHPKGHLSEHGDKPEHECTVDYYGCTTLSTSLLLRG